MNTEQLNQPQQRPDITEEFLERCGYVLVEPFSNWHEMAGIMDFHDELERLGNDYGQENVIGSLFRDHNSRIVLGTFVTKSALLGEPEETPPDNDS